MIETKEDSMKKRIMEAKKYQKMAIQALIPEEQKQHMECIEKEMKTMLVNGVLDLMIETGTMERVMKYAMHCFCGEDSDRNDNDEMETSGQVKYNTETEYSEQRKCNVETESNRQRKYNVETEGRGQRKDNVETESSRQRKDNVETEGSRQRKDNVEIESNGQEKYNTKQKNNRKCRVRKIEVGV